MRRPAARWILFAMLLAVFVRAGTSQGSAHPAQAPGSSQAPLTTGTITGTVVAADTGRPVRMARLTLSDTTGARIALTTDDGRFTFDGLPPGRFTLEATQEQFLVASYGQKRPSGSGTPIEIAEGQLFDVRLPMTRGGVIAGMVFDESGEPVVSARVRALRYIPQNGFKRLRVVDEVQTDDRGMYRAFGLQPGDYLISAVLATDAAGDASNGFQVPEMLQELVPEVVREQIISAPPSVTGVVSGGQSVVNVSEYSPTFYPSAATAGEASRITLEGSIERAGIDIRVLPLRTGSIVGTVSGSPEPSVRVQVLLQNADIAAEPTTMTTNASTDGRFTLNGLAPGPYVVYAQTLPNQPPPVVQNGNMIVTTADVRTTAFDRLHGRTAVTVDGALTPEINIALKPGRSISGRVVFAMAQPPDRTRVATTISIVPFPQNPPLPAFNTSPQVGVDADGTFTLPGIRPGRFILRASGPGTLKSAMLNGEDTLDTGVEVTAEGDVTDVVLTLTDRVSVLSGTLSDTDGKPVSDCTVVVAPTDSQFWRQGSRRILTTRPATAGGYAFRGLPAGEYYLAAVADLETGGQYDTDFLGQLAAAAVRVIIGDGGSVSQNLRLSK